MEEDSDEGVHGNRGAAARTPKAKKTTPQAPTTIKKSSHPLAFTADEDKVLTKSFQKLQLSNLNCMQMAKRVYGKYSKAPGIKQRTKSAVDSRRGVLKLFEWAVYLEEDDESRDDDGPVTKRRRAGGTLSEDEDGESSDGVSDGEDVVAEAYRKPASRLASRRSRRRRQPLLQVQTSSPHAKLERPSLPPTRRARRSSLPPRQARRWSLTPRVHAGLRRTSRSSVVSSRSSATPKGKARPCLKRTQHRRSPSTHENATCFEGH